MDEKLVDYKEILKCSGVQNKCAIILIGICLLLKKSKNFLFETQGHNLK